MSTPDINNPFASSIDFSALPTSQAPSLGLGDTNFNQTSSFDYGNAPIPGLNFGVSQAPSMTDFNGFNQSQMQTNGSFGSVGSGLGAIVGGPMGSAIGGAGGTAVDMYMSYRADEERKRAERQRLEEARRQQLFANRQADRDRALAASQYEDKMGFLNKQEGRTQEGFDMDMKQKRVNMLRDALNNSLKHSDTVRSLFAKRGVV